MAIEYHFNNLDPTSFQRLINAILVSKFGEAIRLLPLRGKDGGRDAETPPGTYIFDVTPSTDGIALGRNSYSAPHRGRVLFQVKHHRTQDAQVSAVRASVVSDFVRELRDNVLTRTGDDSIDYFYLVTNVPSSGDVVTKIDEKRRELLGRGQRPEADVLWGEHVTAWLDQLPQVWNSFPDLFAGRLVPQLGLVAGNTEGGLPRAIRAALAIQFAREGTIRFQQLRLEEKLPSLFVDLAFVRTAETTRLLRRSNTMSPRTDLALVPALQAFPFDEEYSPYWASFPYIPIPSCTALLITDDEPVRQGTQRLILEGGPGQGKSTMTQMVAQIYRAVILGNTREYLRFGFPSKARLPIRIELRLYSEWMEQSQGTIETYIARTLSKDSGGSTITVDNIHEISINTPLLLIFDGLDEVGSDEARDAVLTNISECLERLEVGMTADVKTILTTRPPAIAGRSSKLAEFISLKLASLDDARMDEYIQRWTNATCADDEERQRIIRSFGRRRQEPHVNALAKNPMQLSVLLHFIRSQGEAFPDRRAELYREYFKTVIDRDVEKTPRLRSLRGDIETLHQLIAFRLHCWAETERSSGSISRRRLIDIVEDWLIKEHRDPAPAQDLFRLGEERLGLIVALAGEGGETRYGFEIQPVREYFAAAYINEAISRDAHELFELMARRSFWREVALLLAGLRRANEKADLLSRARTLDEDPQLGWRQDGHNIVLDLLSEGVLSTPGGVQRDAILLLLQSLDPLNGKPRNESRELLAALPGIIRACTASAPFEEIMRFLNIGLSTNDTGALGRLYKVACRTLPVPLLEEHIRGLAAQDTRLSAMRHVTWPDNTRLSLSDISRTEGFWPPNVSRTWAEAWYLSVLEDPSKSCLAGDSAYHEFLFECFTWTRVDWATIRRDTSVAAPSQWAVWRLRQNLAEWCSSFGSKEDKSEADVPVRRPVDYSGLSGNLSSHIQDLLESSSLYGSRSGRKKGRNDLEPFLAAIGRALEQDGLVGWIACRCAVSLIEASELYKRPVQAEMEPGGRLIWVQQAGRGSSSRERLDSWRHMCSLVAELYREAGPTSASKLAAEGWLSAPPDSIRVGSRVVSVARLLKSCKTDVPESLQWLFHMPVPRSWFGTLLSDEKSKVPVLLAHLAKYHSLDGPFRRLKASLISKVLGIVRRSDDQMVASGGLVALLGSSLWSLADTQTLLRMVQLDAAGADISARLFDLGHDKDDARPDRVRLARAIIQEEFVASRSSKVAAAQYLAANDVPVLAPLNSLVT